MAKLAGSTRKAGVREREGGAHRTDGFNRQLPAHLAAEPEKNEDHGDAVGRNEKVRWGKMF